MLQNRIFLCIMTRILLIIIISQCTLLYCQDGFSVEGLVFDKNQNPIQFLAVKILSAQDNSKILLYTFTDDSGRFYFENVDEGKYVLQFVLMGFEFYQVQIELYKNLQLETIFLNEQNIDLEEVVLIANKKAIELSDRGILLNVKGTPLENQRNVSGILKYAPNMNGLEIMGSSNIKLSINGKDVKIDAEHIGIFLNSINPNTIKSIEVIDRADASFEGNVSGQINIVMESEEGFSGSVSNTLSRNNRYGFNYNPSVFYLRKNLRLYSFYYQSSHTSRFRDQEIQIIDDNIIYNNSRNTSLKRQEKVLGFGADFTLDSLNNISFIYNFTSDNDREHKTISKQDIQSSIISDSLIINNRELEHFYDIHTFSLQYRKKLDTIGSYLNLSADFASNNYRNPLVDKNAFFSDGELKETTITSQPDDTNSDIYSLQIMWSKKNTNGNALSIGSKYSFNRNNNHFRFFDQIGGISILNENFSNDFYFNENIYALFTDYLIKLKKLSLSLGSRLEYNLNRFGENRLNNSNQNFKWLPTFNLNLPISENNNFTLYASKKNYRPSYYSYNPTLVRTSPTQASSGNPDLSPVDVYRIQFGYTYKRKYSASLRYDYLENNLIPTFQFIHKEGFTLSTLENTGYRNNLYFMLSTPVKFFKWWESTNKLNLNYTNFSTPQIVSKQDFEATFGSVDSYHTFNLSDAVSIDFNLSYATPRKSMYKRYGDNFSSDASISYTFLKEYFNFNIWISDIFNTQRDLTEYQFNEIFRRTNTKANSRTIFINFIYSFNFGKMVNDEIKDSNIEDEKRRVRH